MAKEPYIKKEYGEILGSDEWNQLQVMIREELDQKLARSGDPVEGDLEVQGRVKDQNGYLLPVGSVTAFMGSLPPEGWLSCDGSPLPAEEKYDELRRITGNRVPDMRGMFLRGVSGTREDQFADPDIQARSGKDDPNTPGSVQEDELKAHHHVYYAAQEFSELETGNGNTARIRQDRNTSDTGGSETRPKNIYVNWIIKY